MEGGWLSVNIVPKKDWGGKPYTDEVIPLVLPVSDVLHTFTDTDPCDSKETCIKAVRELQESHMGEGLPDIKYNFVIGGDGNVYEGRGWEMLPDLNLDYTDLWERSIEIAHIGRAGDPSAEVLFLAKELLNIGVKKNFVKYGFGYHKQFTNVEEDEDEFTMNVNKELVRTSKKRVVNLYESTDEEEEDGEGEEEDCEDEG